MTRADDRIGVLFFTSAPFLGGTAYGVRSIIRQLDPQRFRPVLAYPESNSAIAEFFRGVDVCLQPIATRPLARWSPAVPLDLLSTVRELARICREQDIRIFHSTAPRAAVLGPLLRARTGVKFVWQIAMLGQPWFLHFLSRFPDRAPCVSHAVCEEFGRRSNMQVIYNGPWTEILTAAEWNDRRRALRAELGIAEDALVVGGMANLQFWKGVHVLLEGFALAARAMPEILLVHLGGAVPGYESYARQIDSQIAALDLGTRIRRLGFRADGYRYFPLFDLFVHVPVTEGRNRCTEAFGHAVAEAMSYRLPVISSRIGGPVEIVEEGVTGELIEPGNARELGEKIATLLRDPARRLRMADAGYARYVQHFTIEREVRAYEQIYLQLVSSNGRTKSLRVLPPNSGNEGGNFRPYWSALLQTSGMAEKLTLMEIEQAPFVAMLRRFLNGARGSLWVLEVGTGSAAALRQLAQSVSGELCGLDLVPEALLVARQAEALSPAAKVRLVAADVFHAPFRDESFDLVFSQGLIEHFPDPGGILQAQARLVKPGSWLVVSVPQTFNPYTLYKHWRMRRGAWGPGWETQYTPHQLSRLAARIGFDLLAVDGYGSFASRVCARLFRPVLSLRRAARLIRTTNSADRLLGERLRSWLSVNVVACYRKPETQDSTAAEVV